MGTGRALIGRDRELGSLERALARAAAGEGSIVLVAGEAGVGKTRLAEALAERADGLVLRGATSEGATGPYGPIAGALRSFLRQLPEGLDECGPLRSHVAILIPELGEAAAQTDRETLFEALRCALATAAGAGASLVLLDDLQWSDAATLDLLAALAPQVEELPLLIVAAYRSDELGRDHPVRHLRDELRRAGGLDELALEPLPSGSSGELAARVFGGELSADLAATIHDRAQGYPFFVEELAAALLAAGAVREADGRFELADAPGVPIPDTIRDAVLMRIAGISPSARAAAEAAAVAGERFPLGPVARLASDEGLGELAERGLVAETNPGWASFRHALAREAIYEDVPWLRRQSLHRRLAQMLGESGGAPAEVAAHWRGARDEAQARRALLDAVAEFRAAHAYRDAAAAGREALELWPHEEDPAGRRDAIESYGECAQLAGDLAEAARAWREAAAIRRTEGSDSAQAELEQRLANVYSLLGDRARAVVARRAAADAFEAAGMPAEAASNRIAAATYLQSSGGHAEAAELAACAAREAEGAARPDLRARALGFEGAARAKRGEFEPGLEKVRAGLSIALEHNLTAEAADLYQRLGTVLETSADYAGAREALDSALSLCGPLEEPGPVRGCVACMAYVLRELGEWDAAAELCEQLNDDPGTPDAVRVVTDGILGSIHAFRGDLAAAREPLDSCLRIARRLDVLSMQIDSAAALAWLAALDAEPERARAHCRFVLERWERSEDRHYAVWGMRLAASILARERDSAGVHTCAEALAAIASESGHADALAALAHALGEAALLEGDAAVAAEHFARALELHDSLEVPFERAQIELRAGVALAAAGEREEGVTRLADAHRAARRLGSRPLAAAAAAEVAALGESVEERLGRRAAAEAEGGGLSRRELEVLRLAAEGQTNREIAGQLYLSPRTVDMHVRNMLAKLGCRSRTEAASKARKLELID